MWGAILLLAENHCIRLTHTHTHTHSHSHSHTQFESKRIEKHMPSNTNHKSTVVTVYIREDRFYDKKYYRQKGTLHNAIKKI